MITPTPQKKRFNVWNIKSMFFRRIVLLVLAPIAYVVLFFVAVFETRVLFDDNDTLKDTHKEIVRAWRNT